MVLTLAGQKTIFLRLPSQNGENVAPIQFKDDGDVATVTETFAIVKAQEGEIPDASDVIKVHDDAGVEDTLDEHNLMADHGNGVEIWSGCAVNKPTRLIEEIGATVQDTGLSKSDEENYYNTMWKLLETGFVGAGLEGGFINMNELHVMKYKEAMAGQDALTWQRTNDEEHNHMLKHHVWEPVLVKDLLDNSKVLTSTWAMKRKANGTYHVHMNAHGFKQIDDIHDDETKKAAPAVACEITIHMVMVLMLVMALWWAKLLDMQGAFLRGEMNPKTQCYLHVPEEFEQQFYPSNMVLHLLKTLYGLKQNTYEFFWKMLVMAMKHMGCSQSEVDPCLLFKWTVYGLVLWVM